MPTNVDINFKGNAQDINTVIDTLEKRFDALRQKANIPFGATGAASGPASGGASGFATSGTTTASTSAAGVVTASTLTPARNPFSGSAASGSGNPPYVAPSMPNPNVGAAGVVNAMNTPGSAGSAGSGGYGGWTPPQPPPPPPGAGPPPPGSGNPPPGGGSGSGYPGYPGSVYFMHYNPVSNVTNPANPNTPNNPNRPQRTNWGVTLLAHGLAGGLNQYAANQASGELDPMSAAQLTGGIAGAAVGTAAGMALGQPYLGALAGQSLGSAGAALAIAPFLRTRSAALELASYAARSRFNPIDEIIPGRAAGASLEALSEEVSFSGKSAVDRAKIRLGVYTGADVLGVPALARTVATLGSAALEAGEDPRSLITETAARLGKRYGLATPQIAQMAAPVLADANRQGRNATDLLLTHGVEAYGAYRDVEGQPDLTSRQRSTVGALQINDNLLDRTGYRARGVGKAREGLYQSRMDALADLPDGSSSVAYAEARAGKRSATLQKYADADALEFDIPGMALAGRKQRRQYLPYEPGAMMKDAMQDAQLKAREFRVKSTRYTSLLATGGLSESQQASAFGELEDIKTDLARDYSTLNVGVENRLLGLSAGRPSYRSHWDSMALTRYAMFQVNSPNMTAGAVNGQHLRMQRNWQAAFSTPDFNASAAFAPHSRTAGVNNVMTSPQLDTVIRLLSELVRGGRPKVGDASGGLRPGEARGNRAATQEMANFDPRRNY